MLNRFIPIYQLRPDQAHIEANGRTTSDLTMEDRKIQLKSNLNFNRVKRMPMAERKVQLAADFKFNWVNKMPLDMVREFHKHLDYDSRVAELLHKYPFILRRAANVNGPTLDHFFTQTQLGKIWQEGFVKKITYLKGNKRLLKRELVEMFPERPARIYADLNGNEQVWTGIRHKLVTDFERSARPVRRDGVIRPHDIQCALMHLLNVRTEFPVFDRFLRRTAYYLIAGIIIFRETVIAAHKKREAILAAKAAAKVKEYQERWAANRAARQAKLEAAKNARKAVRTAAKNALKAERAGMRAEEKATRDLAAEQAKAEKQVAVAQAKAEKQAAAEQAKAEKQAAAEQAKAAKQAAAEQVKAAKQAAVAQAKAEKQAAVAQAKAEKQAAAEQVKAEKQAAKVVAREQAKAAKQAAKVVAREQAKAAKQAAAEQVKTEKRVVKVVLRIRQPSVE
jgi:DNA segregation ATPase FtsK/SpoIIIE-like protein